MHCLTCTTITSVDLAHYGVSRAKDWVSVDCGTKAHYHVIEEYIYDGNMKHLLVPWMQPQRPVM